MQYYWEEVQLILDFARRKPIKFFAITIPFLYMLKWTSREIYYRYDIYLIEADYLSIIILFSIAPTMYVFNMLFFFDFLIFLFLKLTGFNSLLGYKRGLLLSILIKIRQTKHQNQLDRMNNGGNDVTWWSK